MSKTATCPYADGTDVLKFHWLLMPKAEAEKMDQKIKAARGPVCGQPIHPGSCMCREHMRFSRGYRQAAQPYPEKGAAFTCIHSPDSFDSEDRWIVHDKNGHFCAEFDGEDEAKCTVDEWIAGAADRVTIDWKTADDDADDSDRGTYYIGLSGIGQKITVRAGWHSMEAAAEKSAQIRKLLLTSGYESARLLFEVPA